VKLVSLEAAFVGDGHVLVDVAHAQPGKAFGGHRAAHAGRGGVGELVFGPAVLGAAGGEQAQRRHRPVGRETVLA
jgi:hypothetical protein